MTSGQRRRPEPPKPELRALVIPADLEKPVYTTDLNAGGGSLANLQRLVGGMVEVQSHLEGDVWGNDEARLIDLPFNVRVNWWQLHESEARLRGLVGESTMAYGDVVMTGEVDDDGEQTPVEEIMVEYFNSLDVNKDALRDWDVREVEFRFTEWPEAPGEGRGLD